MGGLKPTFIWSLLSLAAAATFAHPDQGLLSLHLNTVERRGLDTFSLHKRCVGTCEECFGESYQECASSSSICFKPGDPQHGEETCSESGTTVPTVPTTDYCSGSCQSCFGASSTECPGSTSQCYIPGDSESGMESCSSSGSDSSGTTPSSSSDSAVPSTVSDSSSTAGSNTTTTTDFCDDGGFDCMLCFGSTYIRCPDTPDPYCYDPNNSTSICPDGTSPGGSSGSSSGGGSVAGSGSSTYTASTDNAGSSSQDSAATGTNNAGINGISSTASPASGNTRTSSATGTGQTSTSAGSNGNPANATTNDQPSSAEGMFGVLAVLALCFTVSYGLVI